MKIRENELESSKSCWVDVWKGALSNLGFPVFHSPTFSLGSLMLSWTPAMLSYSRALQIRTQRGAFSMGSSPLTPTWWLSPVGYGITYHPEGRMARGRPGDTPRDDGTNVEPGFQFKKCHEFRKSSVILFWFCLKNCKMCFYVFISFSRLSFEAHCVHTVLKLRTL